MRKYLFSVTILAASYFSAFSPTSSQTRTATFLNYLDNFRDVIGDRNYTTATALDGVITN